MASIVILTRAKLAGRTGPSSARYEIGRNNALAESLGIDAERMREFTLIQVVELIRLRDGKGSGEISGKRVSP